MSGTRKPGPRKTVTSGTRTPGKSGGNKKKMEWSSEIKERVGAIETLGYARMKALILIIALYVRTEDKLRPLVSGATPAAKRALACLVKLVKLGRDAARGLSGGKASVIDLEIFKGDRANPAAIVGDDFNSDDDADYRARKLELELNATSCVRGCYEAAGATAPMAPGADPTVLFTIENQRDVMIPFHVQLGAVRALPRDLSVLVSGNHPEFQWLRDLGFGNRDVYDVNKGVGYFFGLDPGGNMAGAPVQVALNMDAMMRLIFECDQPHKALGDVQNQIKLYQCYCLAFYRYYVSKYTAAVLDQMLDDPDYRWPPESTRCLKPSLNKRAPPPPKKGIRAYFPPAPALTGSSGHNSAESPP